MSTTVNPTPQSAPASQPARTLRISTRSSVLAIAQTTIFKSLLASHPSRTVSQLPTAVHPIHTSLGDTDKTTDLHTLANNTAGKSLWTDDLEDALLKGHVDVIVHSLKDVPTRLGKGFKVAAVGRREEKRDCLVLPLKHRSTETGDGTSQYGKSGSAEPAPSSARHILEALPPGSVVGTSSIRRAAMLRRSYPHLRVESVRGNVPTRLRKLDESVDPPPAPPPSQTTAGSDSSPLPVRYDAVILAAAGIQRLGLSHRISAYLDREKDGFMYAVGQGALGVEWREGDEWMDSIVAALCELGAGSSSSSSAGHEDKSDVTTSDAAWSGWQTFYECAAERALLRELEGGCSVPVGVEAVWASASAASPLSSSGSLTLHASVISPDGKDCVSTSGQSEGAVDSESKAEELGTKVALDLRSKGAGAILKVVEDERKQRELKPV